MGRTAGGVRGINLEQNDAVVALAVVVPDAALLVAGENGVGKRTDFAEYRQQSRGGKGIITMKTTEKTGVVVVSATVKDADEIMSITVMSQNGAHTRQRHSGSQPQHARRQLHRIGNRRQIDGHRASH